MALVALGRVTTSPSEQVRTSLDSVGRSQIYFNLLWLWAESEL